MTCCVSVLGRLGSTSSPVATVLLVRAGRAHVCALPPNAVERVQPVLTPLLFSWFSFHIGNGVCFLGF